MELSFEHVNPAGVDMSARLRSEANLHEMTSSKRPVALAEIFQRLIVAAILEQGPPNFFVRGPHKLYYTTVRGPDILRTVLFRDMLHSAKFS